MRPRQSVNRCCAAILCMVIVLVFGMSYDVAATIGHWGTVWVVGWGVALFHPVLVALGTKAFRYAPHTYDTLYSSRKRIFTVIEAIGLASTALSYIMNPTGVPVFVALVGGTIAALLAAHFHSGWIEKTDSDYWP